MLEWHFKDKIGNELKATVNTFYLLRDPLAANEQPALQHGVFYVTEPHWFFSIKML